MNMCWFICKKDVQSQLERPIIPTEEVPFTFRWELSQHISMNIQTKHRMHEGGSLNQRKWSRMTDADQFCLIAECLFCLWKCISRDNVAFIYPNPTRSRRRAVVWPRWELGLIVVVSYVTGPDSLSKNQFNSKIITAEEQKNFRSCNRKLSGGAWRGINGFLFVPADWLAGSAQYKTTTTTTARCSDLCRSFNSAAVRAARTVFC